MREVLWEILQAVSENELLSGILDTGIAVSVVILLLLLIRPFMKKLPRIGMYVLWLALGIRLLCPVSIRGIYAVIPKSVGTTLSETSDSIKMKKITSDIERTVEQSYGGAANNYQLPENSVKNTIDVLPEEAERKGGMPAEKAETEADRIPLDVWLVAIWGTGVFLLFLYLAVSLIYVRLRFSDACRIGDKVYVHPLVENSFVSGIFSPRIYLSESIAEKNETEPAGTFSSQEYILCHENVHIRRRDYLIKPAMFLAFSLHWFNPLMWVAYRLFVKDMEVSCDEAVIRKLGTDSRKKYSELLLALTADRGNGYGYRVGFSIGTMKDRIGSIMRYRKPTVITSLFLVVITLFFGCGIVSAPEETSLPERKETANQGIYVEQVLESGFTDDTSAEGGLPEGIQWCGDAFFYQNRLYGIAYNEKDGVYIMEGKEGGCSVSRLSENKDFQRLIKYSGWEVFVGADGNLYMSVDEFSIPPDVEAENPDKYKGKFYRKKSHLIRLQRENDTQTELKTPQELMNDTGLEKEPTGKGMAYNRYEVFSDGRILVWNGGNIHGIYDGVTGEKQADIMSSSAMAGSDVVVAGNGFFAYSSINQSTGKIDVNIGSEDTGKIEYTVDTGLKYDKDDRFQYALAAYDSEVIMANREGIFKLEYGEDTFTKVIEPSENNIYYLAKENTQIYDVSKSDDGDYCIVAGIISTSIDSEKIRVLQYTRPKGESGSEN